mgnify:FL=1
MKRKAVSGIVFILLVVSILELPFPVQRVGAVGTIYIKQDGTVDPSTAPIQRDGNIYTITDDVYKSIFVQKDNIVIDGNGYTLQGTGSGCGLYLSNRRNVTLKKTRITRFEYGIYLTNYSSGINISGNNIVANGVGVSLSNSSSNSIFGNKLTNNTAGISLNHSSNNRITKNNLRNSIRNGLGLEYSDGNNITGNNIINTNYWGIELHYSDGNTITENNLMDTVNGSGILLGHSRRNKIYHNNFINNSVSQVFLYDTYKTVWDDGYPSGGNYWSDYAGIDDYSGPNQDQLGDDGIGDTPYVIDYNNIDTYPLMGPWTEISGSLQILEPDDGSKMTGPATIIFVIENTGEDVEFLKGDPDNRIDLEIEYRSAGGEIDGWGILLWSTSYDGLTLFSEEKCEETLVYDPSKYKESVPPNFVGEAPFGEAIIRLVHWRSLEPEGYGIGEFGKAEIQVTFLSPAIVANLDLKPDTVKLKSKGRWITTYIELPEDYSVSDIDISTVELNGEIPAELHPTEIGDYDNDGVPDLMVKFSRQDLIAILSAGEAILTITGEVNGTSFEGTDTIRVMGK